MFLCYATTPRESTMFFGVINCITTMARLCQAHWDDPNFHQFRFSINEMIPAESFPGKSRIKKIHCMKISDELPTPE